MNIRFQYFLYKVNLASRPHDLGIMNLASQVLV